MIGVIADDLTGAAELGAMGLRHGLKAEIVLAGDAGSDEWRVTGDGISRQPAPGPRHAGPDLLCVDTDSRLCAPEEAARRARAAAAWLLTLGARWIYKKVDSVLRGQVTSEIEAVMAETGSGSAFLVPANPGLGRVIRHGRYYVRGIPVHESEFAHDGAYPRTSSFVLEMISPPRAQPLRACAVGDALPERGIVIGEAESAADLDYWARAGEAKALRTGGAEFFAATLRAEGCRLMAAGRPRPRAVRVDRELFVCGTNSNAAREFHAAVQAEGVPVIGLPAQAAAGVLTASEQAELVRQVVSAFESNSRVVLRVGLERVTDPVPAARLSGCVVRVAQGILGQVAVDRVYAEGGATAVELARTLGWRRLRVLRELAPGVAALGLKGRPAELTIKPGSYAWPTDVINPQPKAHEPDRS